jgi:hypothetical protein
MDEERYEWNDFVTGDVYNYETGTVVDAIVELNKQDKEIEKLTKTVLELQTQLENTEKMRLVNLEEGQKCVERDRDKIEKLIEENKFLKTQLEADKYIKESGYSQDTLDLMQLYSHLGVEAFGKDIQEQALKEIHRLQKKLKNKKDNKSE